MLFKLYCSCYSLYYNICPPLLGPPPYRSDGLTERAIKFTHVHCFILLPAALLVKVAHRHTPKFQSVAYGFAGLSYRLGVERLRRLRLEDVGGYLVGKELEGLAYVGGSTEMKSWSVFGTCMVSGIRRVEKVRELEWVMGQMASDGGGGGGC